MSNEQHDAPMDNIPKLMRQRSDPQPIAPLTAEEIDFISTAHQEHWPSGLAYKVILAARDHARLSERERLGKSLVSLDNDFHAKLQAENARLTQDNAALVSAVQQANLLFARGSSSMPSQLAGDGKPQMTLHDCTPEEYHAAMKAVRDAAEAKHPSDARLTQALADRDKRIAVLMDVLVGMNVIETGSRKDMDGDSYVRHHLRIVLDHVTDLEEATRIFNEQSQILVRTLHEKEAAEAEAERLKARLLTAAGDDLCRLTSEEIKQYTSGEVQIPPKEEFIPSCRQFWKQTADRTGVLKNCLTLAQLVAENERLTQQYYDMHTLKVQFETKAAFAEQHADRAEATLAAIKAHPDYWRTHDELSKRAEAAESRLSNLLARIFRDGGQHQESVGVEAACEEADGLVANMLDAEARADTLAEQLLAVQRQFSDATEERDKWKSIGDKRLCGSCLEHHPMDVMCPPHEVRTTGQAWFNERLAELRQQLAAVTAERDEIRAFREREGSARAFAQVCDARDKIVAELTAAQAKLAASEAAVVAYRAAMERAASAAGKDWLQEQLLLADVLSAATDEAVSQRGRELLDTQRAKDERMAKLEKYLRWATNFLPTGSDYREIKELLEAKP